MSVPERDRREVHQMSGDLIGLEWDLGVGTHHHYLPMAQGLVPFLGTFLTDLVMLDTAMEEYVDVSDPWGIKCGNRITGLETKGSWH